MIRCCETEGLVSGFYHLGPLRKDRIELEAMFVEPSMIGSGIGALLFADCLAHAREAGATALVAQSDPFAEGFYLHMGMRRIGERPSGSIAGRILPLLEIALADHHSQS